MKIEELKEKDYDFMVGFTLFGKTRYKTIYRHFNKLEHAKLFSSNVNIKNNCKLYVDLDYYNELEKQNKELKNTIKELEEIIDIFQDGLNFINKIL